MQLLIILLGLFCSCFECSKSSDLPAEIQSSSYSIDANEPMSITGAVFHAYENAWSVSFDVADTNSILFFSLCHEPCPPITTQYRIYECLPMLSIIGDQQWHNQYISTHIAEGEMFCNSIRSAPADVQAGVDKILSDSNGGALVRFRHPNTLVIFNVAFHLVELSEAFIVAFRTEFLVWFLHVQFRVGFCVAFRVAFCVAFTTVAAPTQFLANSRIMSRLKNVKDN